MIGRIERVPLREVWKHEAADFTSWLCDNIDVLDEVLDVRLTAVGREQAAGVFSVDLVAQDEAGRRFVIENQLEKSDHDHLGKLVTYLSAFDAKAAVWVVSEARPEHVAAVAWLNQSRLASFYMVKIDAVRIGDSHPALLPTLIVGPSPEGRAIADIAEGLAEGDELRQRFWVALLDAARKKTQLHSSVSASTGQWCSVGAGRSGLLFSYGARQRDCEAHLWIDTGDGERNLAIYEALAAEKGSVEQVFGGPLTWDQHEARRACAIRHRMDVGGYKDEERWPQVHVAMVDAMVRLEEALRDYIAALRV